MTINGKVHCLFEQSGTFKKQFKDIGINALDYDIQNNFGETDHQVDLFAHIEQAYDGKPSLFDTITTDDLVMAFFPCIYFCENNQLAMSWHHANYQRMSYHERTNTILERMENRQRFITLLYKMVTVAQDRGLRMILENPYNGATFLKQNFVKSPSIIDKNRMTRGDYFVKPTAYWFFNCEPTHCETFQKDKEQRHISDRKLQSKQG